MKSFQFKFHYLIIISIIFLQSCRENVKQHEKDKDGEVNTNINEENKFINNINKRDSAYEMVVIGNQGWMTNNLAVRTFRNGDSILFASTDKEWITAGKERIPAYCLILNDGNDCGLLYNWYAVNDRRGLAPEGWKIPNKKDFKNLLEHYNGIGSYLLNKTLDDGNSYKHKFKAFYCGMRLQNGKFTNEILTFWTSDKGEILKEDNLTRGICLYFDEPMQLLTAMPASYGMTVRCIKDIEN